MFLSQPDIIKCLESGDLAFAPSVPNERIAQVSVDLLLGHRFTILKKKPYITSIQMDPSIWESEDLWEEQERNDFKLDPGQFVLAQTLERVKIPDSLMGMVEGRSSFARLGIAVHLTAPKIDPGFEGTITLELANFGTIPFTLRAGIDKPVQLLLAKITTQLGEDELYGAGPEDTFQGQETPTPKKE